MAQRKRKTAVKDALKAPEGPLYRIIGEDGKPVYLGKGMPEKEAQRLSDGLVQASSLQEVPMDETVGN